MIVMDTTSARLFAKLSRFRDRPGLAWIGALPVAGTAGVFPSTADMTPADAERFRTVMSMDRERVDFDGANFSYHVNEVIAHHWPYFIIRPHNIVVRELYPRACRVFDLSTGSESHLCRHGIAEACEIVEAAREGRIAGSFGLDRRREGPVRFRESSFDSPDGPLVGGQQS